MFARRGFVSIIKALLLSGICVAVLDAEPALAEGEPADDDADNAEVDEVAVDDARLLLFVDGAAAAAAAVAAVAAI